MPQAICCYVSASDCRHCVALTGDGRLNNGKPMMSSEFLSNFLIDGVIFINVSLTTLETKEILNIEKNTNYLTYIYKENNIVKQNVYKNVGGYLMKEIDKKDKFIFDKKGNKIEWKTFILSKVPENLLEIFPKEDSGIPHFRITTVFDWENSLKNKVQLVQMMPSFHPELEGNKISLVPDSDNWNIERMKPYNIINKIKSCIQTNRIVLIDRNRIPSPPLPKDNIPKYYLETLEFTNDKYSDYY